MTQANTVELTLKYPVTDEGKTHTSLHIARPKVGDMITSRKMQGDDADKEVFLFAKLASVSPSVIHQLDLADYKALQEVYQGFLS